jgi:hypothetical protein
MTGIYHSGTLCILCSPNPSLPPNDTSSCVRTVDWEPVADVLDNLLSCYDGKNGLNFLLPFRHTHGYGTL